MDKRVYIGVGSLLVIVLYVLGCIGGDDSVNLEAAYQATTDPHSNYTQTNHRNYIKLVVTTNSTGYSTNVYGALPRASYIEKFDIDTGTYNTTGMNVSVRDVQTDEYILELISSVTNTTYYPRRMIDNRTAGSQRDDFDKFFVSERVYLNIEAGGTNGQGTFLIFYS